MWVRKRQGTAQSESCTGTQWKTTLIHAEGEGVVTHAESVQ